MGDHILVIGSSNMDVFIKTAKVPAAGESSFGSAMSFLPGGKGSNQATALARLGADVRFSAKIGKDSFGDGIYHTLLNEKLDPAALFIDEQTATGVAFIIVEESGENRIIVLPGANMAYQEAEVDQVRPLIESARIVLLQLEIPIPSVKKIIAIARRHKVPVVVDAGPAQSLPLDLFQGVTILSPNETEARALTGVAIADLDSAKRAGKILLASGAQIVVLKLGDQGALVGDATGFRHHRAYAIEAVDTTAAGDAFSAALTFYYSRGYSIDESVKFANAVGALTATRAGSLRSLPSREEVASFVSARGGIS
ncbi:ribokinase [Hydrogenispora ethanolica]|uniref:Ribokinase n=1 Tax=Hydrogenispora ethanolica TaxID=1082276 RepID=A0A4R1S4E5_HYDET|nr:ribokinase [Hydrogenispora ethanolica]TCL74115.1 ribokinase [Hydrogenispora ethanolica]